AFPRLDLFHRVVAENGALLYNPATRDEKPLGEPPPAEFVAALRARGVQPLSIGRSIVATWEPHETAVLEVIRALGLELQVIFNKGAVMVLPAGVNKGSGLYAALRELDLSPHNAVGIGDAENDHTFLNLCECAVAVANALPTLKERADLVTLGAHGDGLGELVDRLVGDDLHDVPIHETLVLGQRDDDGEVQLAPYGARVLVAGPSGSGKSTLAAGLMEQLVERAYQMCILDPEGDYTSMDDIITVGDSQRAPTADEAPQALENPDQDVAINLLGVPLEDRPSRCAELLAALVPLLARTGRPHWLILDEAHHLLPGGEEHESRSIVEQFPALLMITVHPDRISAATLGLVDLIFAVGDSPQQTLSDFARAVGLGAPKTPDVTLQPREALAWFPRTGDPPFRLRAAVSRAERNRHQRKYMQGELGPDKSFYFRGPENRLNLRAQNLMTFLQMADGVDDATWRYHLRRGDYARWFEEAIKDRDLADAARQIEHANDLTPAGERARLREAIEKNYTLPA
ncbi:MAG TPA: HAD-IIB family hydrolase, partial [Ktedonobacterales bacterium]|nr:HAD-IIB family hydrolase [Ktedonobacterales bacterium]